MAALGGRSTFTRPMFVFVCVNLLGRGLYLRNFWIIFHLRVQGGESRQAFSQNPRQSVCDIPIPLFFRKAWDIYHRSKDLKLLQRNLLEEEFFDWTRCHGGNVSGQNNGEKVLWEFDSTIVQNLSDILPLVWHQHDRLVTWMQSDNSRRKRKSNFRLILSFLMQIFPF